MPALLPAISPEQFTSFGDLLKFLRRRAGLTQRELSIAVGYSDAQISRLEQNQRLPDLATISARFVPALTLENEPEMVKRLTQLAAAVRREDAPLPGLPPFKGLHFFDEADANLFFGREALTAKLAAAVGSPSSASAAPRFLAVVGASGSGKSSVVRAGLIPAMRWNPATADWPIHIFTPGARPLEALVAAFAGCGITVNDLVRDPRSLHLGLQRAYPAVGASQVLLVVDQFEELFTLCRDAAQQLAFVDNLLIASRALHGPATVVLTLRADFYAHCAPFENLRQALAQQQEYIGPMTVEALRRAIEAPAQQGGWEFEPELVELLLRDVGAGENRAPEPGALPLLSHALLETWQRRQGRRLTLSGYLSSGGVRGAIAETAEAVFEDQLTAEQRTIARRIFVRLTELGVDTATGDTRRRAGLDELISKPDEAAATREVLQALADARLVTLDASTAEVAHEALIREWPTLRGWLEENREGLRLHRRLTEAARTWVEFGRQPSELYGDARLAQALEWGATSAAELNVLEREFLAASEAQVEREAVDREAQRQREMEAARRLADAEKQRAEEQARSAKLLRRRAFYLAGALLVALMLAAAAGSFGLIARINLGSAEVANTQAAAQRNAALDAQATAQAEAGNRATAEAVALHEGAEARRQALIASVRELASAAHLNLDVDPERSILLALQAVALSEAADQPPLLEAQVALHQAVQASRARLTLRGHTRELTSVTFSPDGTRLATASDDGTLRIWQTATGQELLTLPISITAPNLYRIVSFSPDGQRIAAGTGHEVRVWDAATGQTLLTLAGHTAEVLAVVFSSTDNGARLATASNDGSIRIWDAASGSELLALTDPVPVPSGSLPRMTLAYSPDGTRLATARSATVHVWDLASGQVLLTVSDPVWVNVHSVAFSPDGSQLAVGGSSLSWGVWDLTSGQSLVTAFGHTSILTRVAFDPTGTRLATASEDGTAKLWEAANGRELLTLTGHTSGIEAAAFSPDGNLLATASRDMTVKLWDISPRGGSEWLNLIGHTDRVWGVAYSPDGTRIATGSRDKTVKVWDAATGQELLTLTGFTSQIPRIAVSPDGTRLMVGRGTENEFDATVWDIATGNSLLTLPHAALVFGVAFSPDGRYLATSSADGVAKLWWADTGQWVRDLSGHSALIQTVGFSPDGTRLATASEDNTARVWDVETGETLLTLAGHAAVVWGAAFSPDGSLLATISNDGTAKLWDAETGRELVTLTGHNGPILGLAFSPDGQYLSTASTDRTAKVWEVAAGSGAQPLTLSGHNGPVLGVAFSPDGTRLVTTSGDGTARVYALRLEDLVGLATARLTRTLTIEECQQYLHTDLCPAGP